MILIGAWIYSWWSGLDGVFLGGQEDVVCLMKTYCAGTEVVVGILIVYLLLVLLVVVDLSLVYEGSLKVKYGRWATEKCVGVNF